MVRVFALFPVGLIAAVIADSVAKHESEGAPMKAVGLDGNSNSGFHSSTANSDRTGTRTVGVDSGAVDKFNPAHGTFGASNGLSQVADSRPNGNWNTRVGGPDSNLNGLDRSTILKPGGNWNTRVGGPDSNLNGLDRFTTPKPDTRLVGEPDRSRIQKPDTRIVGEPDWSTIHKPDTRIVGEPERSTIQKPDNRIVGEPDRSTIQKPDTRIVGEPDRSTIHKPDDRIVGEPDRSRIPKPDTRVVGGPDSNGPAIPVVNRIPGRQPGFAPNGAPVRIYRPAQYATLGSIVGVGAISGLGLSRPFHPFGRLFSEFQNTRSAFVPGLQPQVATRYLTQISVQIQTVVTSISSCGTCGLDGGNQVGAFATVIQEFMYNFQETIGACQRIYGDQWISIVSSSFSSLNNVLPNLINFCYNMGLPLNQYFSSTVIQTFRTLGFSKVTTSLNQLGLK